MWGPQALLPCVQCLQGLHQVEHIVVLGTSLAQRLPGDPQLAAELLQHCLNGNSRPPQSPSLGSGADEQARSLLDSDTVMQPPADETLEDRPRSPRDAAGAGASHGLHVDQRDMGYLQQLLQQAKALQAGGDCNLGTSAWTEWLLTVDDGSTAPPHSLYVKASMGDLRLASRVSATY